MGGYLVNFSVYTFAMVGFLFLAVDIYKKSSVTIGNKGNTEGMAIEESLSLSPRKRLHVVRVNGEKFLIAADVDRTEFLAKLDNNEKTALPENVIKLNKPQKLVSEVENKPALKKVNNTVIGTSAIKTEFIKSKESKLSHIKNINMNKPSFMREVLRKLEVSEG